jgi:hypothetical protein
MFTQSTLVCLCLKVQWQVISHLKGTPAPVLQYGSGLFYNFMAKTLGVITPLFFFNTGFYFLLSSLLVHKSYKSRLTYIVRDSSFRSIFACGAGSWGSILSEVFF